MCLLFGVYVMWVCVSVYVMCVGVYVMWMCVGVCEGVLYYLYVYLYDCITFVIMSAFVVNKEIYIFTKSKCTT